MLHIAANWLSLFRKFYSYIKSQYSTILEAAHGLFMRDQLRKYSMYMFTNVPCSQTPAAKCYKSCLSLAYEMAQCRFQSHDNFYSAMSCIIKSICRHIDYLTNNHNHALHTYCTYICSYIYIKSYFDMPSGIPDNQLTSYIAYEKQLLCTRDLATCIASYLMQSYIIICNYMHVASQLATCMHDLQYIAISANMVSYIAIYLVMFIQECICYDRSCIAGYIFPVQLYQLGECMHGIVE